MNNYLADLRQGILADEAQPLLAKDSAARQQRIAWITIGFFCALWLLIGVTVGMVVEGWTFVTALYVMVQIITTIGYGDITVHTNAMKIFMAIYVLGCFFFVANVITNLAEAVVSKRSEQMRHTLAQAEAKLRNRGEGKLRRSMTKEERDAEEIDEAEGALNQVIAAAYYFVIYVLAGTVFYAVFESCSCSYGVTKIDGCVEGPRCAETGGATKTWISSFYMSVITLTTVGFGDHSPKSWIGRIFGCWWMFMGVVSTGAFVSSISDYFMHQKKKARKMERISEKLFKILDIDGNGTLSKHEFQAYALIKYEMISEEDLSNIDQLFERMDKDHSGAVTYAEIEACCDGTVAKNPDEALPPCP